jgi:hypothetical protein
MDHNAARAKKPYARPEVVELGTVSELTLQIDKELGGSDGFTFQGDPIRNAS